MSELDEYDHKVLEKVCKTLCPFYKEGQEYREKEYQCGAYWIVKEKLKNKELTEDELEDFIKKFGHKKDER